jgi:arylformamidase
MDSSKADEQEASRFVFLRYTQQQLDKAYDQSAWAPQMAALETEDGVLSTDTRKLRPPRTDRYGLSDEQLIDIFTPAKTRGAPILVFIHGGAWTRNSRQDVSYPAMILVESGAVYLAPDFGSLKTARLPELVESCRLVVGWAVRNARSFGGDPDRLFLAGHSAGAHLAACVLITNWGARGLSTEVVKGALLLSGMYDLHPVLLSSRSSYLKITCEEEAAFSPMRHLHRIACPVAVVSSDQDSPEFKRQSAVFADALEGMGRLASRVELFNTNHFQEIKQLAYAGSTVSQALFALMGL